MRPTLPGKRALVLALLVLNLFFANVAASEIAPSRNQIVLKDVDVNGEGTFWKVTESTDEYFILHDYHNDETEKVIISELDGSYIWVKNPDQLFPFTSRNFYREYRGSYWEIRSLESLTFPIKLSVESTVYCEFQYNRRLEHIAKKRLGLDLSWNEPPDLKTWFLNQNIQDNMKPYIELKLLMFQRRGLEQNDYLTCPNIVAQKEAAYRESLRPEVLKNEPYTVDEEVYALDNGVWRKAKIKKIQGTRPRLARATYHDTLEVGMRVKAETCSGLAWRGTKSYGYVDATVSKVNDDGTYDIILDEIKGRKNYSWHNIPGGFEKGETVVSLEGSKLPAGKQGLVMGPASNGRLSVLFEGDERLWGVLPKHISYTWPNRKRKQLIPVPRNIDFQTYTVSFDETIEVDGKVITVGVWRTLKASKMRKVFNSEDDVWVYHVEDDRWYPAKIIRFEEEESCWCCCCKESIETHPGQYVVKYREPHSGETKYPSSYNSIRTTLPSSPE